MWPSVSAYRRFCAGTAKSLAAARNWVKFWAVLILKMASAVCLPGQQTSPGQGHGIRRGLGLPLDESRLARLCHRRDHVREQRTVNGLTNVRGDVPATRHLDGLGVLLQRQIAAAPAISLSTDLLEVEVADVRAEVGEAPADALVVSDHDAGQAGEGETGHVKGTGF
jgi:hypothetical protein